MADTNRIDETLSALMDNEVTELELRRALREVSENPEHRETWRRYQLAAAAMRRELPQRLVDLSSRISAAIDEEPAYQEPLFQRWIKPLGRVAIAASVAMVAVFGAQYIQQSPNVVDSVATAAVTDSGSARFQLPAGFDLPTVSARTVSTSFQPQYQPQSQPRQVLLDSDRAQPTLSEQKAIRDYLNAMMQRHAENSANVSSQGMIPLARLPHGVIDEP